MSLNQSSDMKRKKRGAMLNKFYRLAAAAALVAVAPVASGASDGDAGDFGTRAEAVALAEALIDRIEREGLQAGIDAVFDRSGPYAATRQGVNLFAGPVLIADNREPEMVAAAFDRTPDMTGVPAWPRIVEARRSGGDAVLTWYHYDTQAAYDYRCVVRGAATIDASVMICR